MENERSQGLGDLAFRPIRMLRSKSGSFELAHFFDEIQANLEPARRRHFAQRSDLLGVKSFAHSF
jgi:hypothetical protein